MKDIARNTLNTLSAQLFQVWLSGNEQPAYAYTPSLLLKLTGKYTYQNWYMGTSKKIDMQMTKTRKNSMPFHGTQTPKVSLEIKIFVFT